MSSGISLAFMVIGLLALVLAFGVLWRRTATVGSRMAPADGVQPADQAEAERRSQLEADRLSRLEADRRSQLEKAENEAAQLRARAEAEAAGIVRRASEAAEQAAQGRREVEEEIRAVKDEVRELRGDLERREGRLAEREQRLDDELRRLEDRSRTLDRLQHDLDRRSADRFELGFIFAIVEGEPCSIVTVRKPHSQILEIHITN